jgi:hypothetical protein
MMVLVEEVMVMVEVPVDVPGSPHRRHCCHRPNPRSWSGGQKPAGETESSGDAGSGRAQMPASLPEASNLALRAAVVVTVSAVGPLPVTEAGLKLHVLSQGNPEHDAAKN